MNEISQSKEIGTVSANSMMMNPDIMGQLSKVANLMASGLCTVPKHLQKAEGDCFAIAMQAMQWGMNPFSVAQKTHLVNGTLGYEAQLVNAVISSSKAIVGRFKYEYSGDWSRANAPDAAVRAGAVINGEDQVTWGEWLYIANVTTKNSPLWKTAPKQQSAYLAVKYWARIYCPEVIMGVYSHDELEVITPNNEAHVENTGEADNPEEEENVIEYYSDDEFDEKLQGWIDFMKKKQRGADGLIATVQSKGKLFTDEQKQALKNNEYIQQEKQEEAA